MLDEEKSARSLLAASLSRVSEQCNATVMHGNQSLVIATGVAASSESSNAWLHEMSGRRWPRSANAGYRRRESLTPNGSLHALCSLSCLAPHELERPEGTVPADMFEATDGDEIAGITQGSAQLGGEGRWWGQREEPYLIFEHDEADPVGCGWALGRDGPTSDTSLGDMRQVGDAQDAPAVELGAQVAHRVWTWGQRRPALAVSGCRSVHPHGRGDRLMLFFRPR